ncbi:MAG: hypothetical protein J7J52_00350, partial [Deltaproteobacteria bacterium]|nr:hypothetical protein [Deltaproteobacteria bacterium]
NRHGRIQNILATHGYENTAWFSSTVLCVFTVNGPAVPARTPDYFILYGIECTVLMCIIKLLRM